MRIRNSLKKDVWSVVFILGMLVIWIPLTVFYMRLQREDLPNGKVQCSVMAELLSKPNPEDGMLCLTERISWEFETYGGEGRAIESRHVFVENLTSEMIEKIWFRDGEFTLIYRVVNTGSITKIPHIKIMWVE